MKHFFLVLVATLALLTVVPLQAQPVNAVDSAYFEQFRGMDFPNIVDKVWLWTCAKNRDMYPDSNLVLPGQVIELPANTFYAAKPNGGQDHMWQASLYFTNEYILPYLETRTVNPISGQTPSYKVSPAMQNQTSKEDRKFPWYWVILAIAVIILIAWLMRNKPSVRVSDPPFLVNPPTPDAPDSVLLPAVERSLQAMLGRGFQVIGVPERGTLNGGPFRTFFSNGTSTVEFFQNEPGWRAHVRFDDGHDRLIVGKFSCFNASYGATDVLFKGTFTPESGTPQRVAVMSSEQASAVESNIQRVIAGDDVYAASSGLPETPTPTPAASVAEATQPAEPTPTESKQAMRLTKLQYSNDKGLNAEGDLTMTLDELKALLEQVQNKPSQGEEKQKQKQ